MKILLINGSPHNKGNTFLALDEMRKIFDQENIQVGNQPIGAVWAAGSVIGPGNVLLMIW